jgi:hypothetical protein
MAVDRDIIGRISENHPRGLTVHQFDVRSLVARVCANQLVITKQPKVAKPGNRVGPLFGDNVTGIGLRRCGCAIDQKINFRCLKTGDFKVKIEVERGEFLHVELKVFEVPSRV